VTVKEAQVDAHRTGDTDQEAKKRTTKRHEEDNAEDTGRSNS